MKMWASMPAAAAYAAMALAALPADGIATFLIPNSTHIETAQERPRALNDAVGFKPSSLTKSASAPILAPIRLVCTSGVQPSPRLTIEASAGGRMGAYRHILAGPFGTSRRSQRWRRMSKSKRTSSGPPQAQRLATVPASKRAPHRLHSRWEALGMQQQV